METRQQLEHVVRIQELALRIQGARTVIDATPGRIDEIETRFRERNAEYVAVKQRFEELEKDQRERSGELAGLEEHLKKYMDDLMQVKNQREYSAILKEIDSVKSQISNHEEAILKDMEEAESIKSDLEARSAHIIEERAAVENERAKVDGEAEAARRAMATCEEERERLERELPGDLVGTLRRLEEARQGLFLAKVENAACQACFVRVRPQVFQEIRQTLRLHTCSNCRRFLYYEPSVRTEPVDTPQAEAGPAGLEARDGGAF